jgi:CheY-specific phosphatase CheX
METPEAVRLDATHLVEDAFREVLAMMFGLAVDGPQSSPEDLGEVLTGTIGLTGPAFQGLLQIRCSREAARSLAAAMLGGEEMLDEDASLISDSLGELANMLGGAVKQRIDQTGVRIEISLPSVVEGELEAEQDEQTQRTVLDFLVDGDPIRTILVHRLSC